MSKKLGKSFRKPKERFKDVDNLLKRLEDESPSPGVPILFSL